MEGLLLLIIVILVVLFVHQSIVIEEVAKLASVVVERLLAAFGMEASQFPALVTISVKIGEIFLALIIVILIGIVVRLLIKIIS